MKSSKTFQLLFSLSSKEKNELNKLFSLNKRKSLKLLYKLCLKHLQTETNITQKAFYELFFKEKYNKTKDYLFRNELRVLNNFIYDFIINKQLKFKLKENDYFSKELYLKHLLNNNSYKLFEKELKKIFIIIETEETYIYSYPFIEMWTLYKNKTIEITNTFFNDTINFYKKAYNFWNLEVSYKTKKLELFKAFIDRTMFLVDRDLTFDKEINSIDFSATSDNIYYTFINNKIKSYKSFGQKKINLLLQCITNVDSISNKIINKNEEKFIIFQLIAVEYMISSENNKALEYLDKSMTYSKTIKIETYTKGLYNYISTLLKIKNYSKAVELFEIHKQKIERSNFKNRFYMIFTMCYIFINNLEIAENINNKIESTLTTENFIYFRCNLSIIHYLNNAKELALTELVNINQSLTYHKNQDKSYNFFVSNFKKLITLTLNSNLASQNKTKLKVLNDKISDSNQKSSINYGGETLQTLWLITEIKRINSSQPS